MKKIFKTLLYLLIAVFFNNSCTKDLTLDPISQISNASYWKTEDDAKGVMFAMYDRLRAEAENNDLFYLGEARSSDISSSFSQGGYEVLWDNSLTSSTSVLPVWTGLYLVVHHANLLLKYVPNIKFTSESSKNNILAQAHAMRAFCYFVMVKTWGDLPLVTEPTEGYNSETTQKERTSKEEIFKLIKKDINDAVTLFPDNNFTTGRYLWSKPAANALKADIYLWTGKRLNGGQADFTTALSALNDIETSDVTLLDNYDQIFRYTNKGNKEIIMSIRFYENESGSNWGSLSYMHPAYLSPYLDAETVAAIGVMGGSPIYAVSSLVRGQFTDDDQRKNATFYEMYITKNGIKSYYGSFCTKYNGFVSAGTRVFADDVVIYRYGDIVLMKAEAKNALGQDPSPEINKVRKRAYGVNYNAHIFTNNTLEKNNEAILQERLFELTTEGKRWWDLIRFGKVFELVPTLKDKVGQDYLLLFPLSLNTLSLETKVKQNPGW